MGAHCADDANCFNRYHPAIKPVLNAKPGQLLTFETRDALDSDLNVNSLPKDVGAVDLNLGSSADRPGIYRWCQARRRAGRNADRHRPG
jgi:acetamidase/formamidase